MLTLNFFWSTPPWRLQLSDLPVHFACYKDLDTCLFKCKGCCTMTTLHLYKIACPDF